MSTNEFIHDELAIQLSMTLRIAQAQDIKKLEWYGQFAHYRNLFRRSYKEQEIGNRLLLVMDCDGFPIARLFIQFLSNNLNIANGSDRAYLYSFTVMELFRNKGIGTKMLASAEEILRGRGYKMATISVAKDNPRALHLYQRMKYVTFAEDKGQWQYRDQFGKIRLVSEPCWLLQKYL